MIDLHIICHMCSWYIIYRKLQIDEVTYLYWWLPVDLLHHVWEESGLWYSDTIIQWHTKHYAMKLLNYRHSFYMYYLCKSSNNNENAWNDTISVKAGIDDLDNWIHYVKHHLQTTVLLCNGQQVSIATNYEIYNRPSVMGVWKNIHTSDLFFYIISDYRIKMYAYVFVHITQSVYCG